MTLLLVALICGGVVLSTSLKGLTMFAVALFPNLNTDGAFQNGQTQSSRSAFRFSSGLFSSSMSGEGEDAERQISFLRQVLYEKEMTRQTSLSWLDATKESSLPFECTSCGKCCRTIGNVYMSPQETIRAAIYCNITTIEFILTYASHTLGPLVRSCMEGEAEHEVATASTPWILLANQAPKGEVDGPACIFLDKVTNHCEIYPVRPIQCSTYPFWSRILESQQTWNDEIRCCDDDIDKDAQVFPPWTHDSGGCEGMRPLSREDGSSGGGASLNYDEGKESPGSVPIQEVLMQMAMYERNDRRLPRGLSLIPVDEGSWDP